MARSEAATLDVHLGAINRTERRIEAELVLAERRIFQGLQREQHLTGECFVDFIEIKLLQRQAGEVAHARDGVGGRHHPPLKRGTGSCRDRLCPSMSIMVVSAPLKK